MGNVNSDMCSNFSPEEITRLAKRYYFYSHLMKIIYLSRFKKLDSNGSGSISVEEFLSLPELRQNPLVQRVIGLEVRMMTTFLIEMLCLDIFDDDSSGEVDFKEFLQGVSQFSFQGNREAKLKSAFRVYDLDNDGFISNGELFKVR